MRFLLTTLVLCAALASAGGEGIAGGRDVVGAGAERVGAPALDVASLSRSELELIARYRGPRGTLRGVVMPGTAREDFSRTTRFDLETHARRYASPPR